MKLGDSLGTDAQKKLFSIGLSKGDVFTGEFPEIDHEKYYIIIGLSADKVFTCSVYINSEIHKSLYVKPELFALQIPISKANNPFLDYDSFACCSTPLPINSEFIFNQKQAGKCRIKGRISQIDLEVITRAIKNSGLLSDEEIELYELNDEDI